MSNDDISCKQHKYSMLEDSSIKASEVHNTRTMQYYAQTTKLPQNRAISWQISGKNMLKLRLKGVENHAPLVAHK